MYLLCYQLQLVDGSLQGIFLHSVWSPPVCLCYPRCSLHRESFPVHLHLFGRSFFSSSLRWPKGWDNFVIIKKLFITNDFLQDFITEPSDLIRVSSESQHYYRFRHGNEIFLPQNIFINYSPFYFQLHLIICQLLHSLSLPDWWLVDWLGRPASSDLRKTSTTDCGLLRHSGSLNNETFNDGFQSSPPEVSKWLLEDLWSFYRSCSIRISM